MKYGYARVSTSDQDLEVQRNALISFGCDTVREEKVSGTSLKGRSELTTLLEFLRTGDELVVTRIDRLARSMRDLQNIVHDLIEKGVHLSATEQSIFKTSVACNTTLPPVKTSSEEPDGIVTSFTTKTVSLVSVSDVSDSIFTLAVTEAVWILQSNKPITTVVVDDFPVYKVRGVPALAGIAPLVFTLNVFAIFLS